MNETTFDSALKTLLQAFRAHEDLRRQSPQIPALARSNYELHKARMAAYHATR